jgi:hypothetical protein
VEGVPVVDALVRVRAVAYGVVSILIAIAIAGLAIAVHRGPSVDIRPVGAPAPASPALAMSGAAGVFEQKTKAGGPGFSFEILQRSALHTKAGGPQIEIPDPVDPHKSLGFADTYELSSLIERGRVTPAGFVMEMRTGPAVGQKPDWNAAYQFGAITHGSKTWRNDGIGWYATDNPPGIGLDPTTASLLPRLLRNAKNPANAGFSDVGGVLLPTVKGNAMVDDAPGVIAVDGASFTELVAPVEFSFDDQGRLAELHSVARNTNLDEFDLLVDTTITFSYPDKADPLPDPVPARKAATDVQS